jgi:hypothetical protein
VAAREAVVETVEFIAGISAGGFFVVAIAMVFICLCVMKQRKRYIKMPMAPPEQAMII